MVRSITLHDAEKNCRISLPEALNQPLNVSANQQQNVELYTDSRRPHER